MKPHVQKSVLAAIAGVAATAAYFFLPAECPEPAKRTAAVFVFAAFFWACEIIPLFATSILVVLFLIFALAAPGGPDANAYHAFLAPFSNPVIMLFLGGFALAKALQKHRVDQAAMASLMKGFGTRPYSILLGFILATGFLALWMSHTAATALMLALVVPVLAKLDADDPFKKALVLAIPFAANIGGIGTPVGTPPNAIALGILKDHGIEVHFLAWMRMAVPLALILLIFASFVLYFMFRPKHKHLPHLAERGEKLDSRGRGALAIAVLTVLLWLTSGWHRIPESVVSLLALGLFAGLGFLDRKDIAGLHWDILILMWGGLALGKAMEMSGLGEWLVSLPFFPTGGFELVAMFALLTVGVSIFVSNTPTANLLVPLAMSFPGEDKLLLAVVVALSCSFDMLLPVSTPSNALAFSTGVISARDMLKSGMIIVAAAIVLLLAGYRFFILSALAA